VTPRKKRQLFTIVLLLVGVRLWLLVPFDTVPTWTSFLPGVVAVLMALIPQVNRRFQAMIFRIRRTFQWHPVTMFFVVAFTVGGYLLLQVWPNRHEMLPLIHDEHSYLIGARMLASGRLWMHAYPPEISPFFETFQVIVDRAYAPIYFPGTAMVNAPFIWLRLSFWTASLVCGSFAAAFVYLILAELFDPIRSLIGVLMLVSLYTFRGMSSSLMSETPFLLAAMILVWSWLRWRRGPRLHLALLMGAAAGCVAITRPLDAVSFVLVLFLAVVFEFRRDPRTLLTTITMAAAGFAPLAVIQITDNIGVTGSWLESPMQLYMHEYYPAPFIGFHQADFNRLSPSLSEPKREYVQNLKRDYENHTLSGELEHWYPYRLNQLAWITLPSPLLIVLFPLALGTINDIRRLAVIGAALVFMAIYLTYLFSQDHYLVPIMPAAICAALMGWESLERAWPGHRRKIATFFILFIPIIAVDRLPGLSPHDAGAPNTLLLAAKQIRSDLSQIPPRSVVLFPFIPEKSEVHAFPVFNDDVAWPDDAPIIRANDLGDERNKELYAYYARVQPDRRFYRYTRELNNDTKPLQYLGTAKELATHK
jgi:hypothetical protein